MVNFPETTDSQPILQAETPTIRDPQTFDLTFPDAVSELLLSEEADDIDILQWDEDCVPTEVALTSPASLTTTEVNMGRKTKKHGRETSDEGRPRHRQRRSRSRSSSGSATPVAMEEGEGEARGSHHWPRQKPPWADALVESCSAKVLDGISERVGHLEISSKTHSEQIAVIQQDQTVMKAEMAEIKKAQEDLKDNSSRGSVFGAPSVPGSAATSGGGAPSGAGSVQFEPKLIEIRGFSSWETVKEKGILKADGKTMVDFLKSKLEPPLAAKLGEVQFGGLRNYALKIPCPTEVIFEIKTLWDAELKAGTNEVTYLAPGATDASKLYCILERSEPAKFRYKMYGLLTEIMQEKLVPFEGKMPELEMRWAPRFSVKDKNDGTFLGKVCANGAVQLADTDRIKKYFGVSRDELAGELA